MELSVHLEIVKKAAESLGLNFEILDKYSKRVAEISCLDQSILVQSPQYFCNSQTAASLAQDKAYTDIILKRAGIATPQGDYFFKVEGENLYSKGVEEAFQYANALGYPVFFKPINGSHGRFARVIHSDAELYRQLVLLPGEYNGFVLQEVVPGCEHRLVILKGKPYFSYKKYIPMLIANGMDSYETLLDKSPYEYERYQEYLSSVVGALSGIPERFQTIPLAANANPNNGGVIEDFRTSFSKAIVDWSAKIYAATKLEVIGVDLFSPCDMDSDVRLFKVLEINSNPFLKTIYQNGYSDVAIGVWQVLLSEHFHLSIQREAVNGVPVV
ncbi:ATP-grasp domain-containing protein [Photobacterium sp. 53610]|uniref:ATP-grasp domain-containing protein n=1 Tax=Photobacterium sp. 53610 TaxID=3102789 RepID=UPI002ED93F16